MKRTRINPRNPKRRARLHERNFGPKADWIRSLPCVVPGCRETRIQAAHAKARGMGGCGGDSRHLTPMCPAHHYEQGVRGIETFEKRYGLNLMELAQEYEQRWQETSTEAI